jgi:excisionase family DNA binding protein
MPKAIQPPTLILCPRKEAAGALGIGLNKLDELIARGEVKAVKIGRSVKIAWTELHRFAAERPAFKPGKAA